MQRTWLDIRGLEPLGFFFFFFFGGGCRVLSLNPKPFNPKPPQTGLSPFEGPFEIPIDPEGHP